DVGQILQELRGLVEKGAIVLVPFNHEIATAAHTVARTGVAKIERNAANEHRGVQSAVRQQPPGERRGRRLPVRAGDDNRPGAPEKMIANRFRQREIADLSLENAFKLRVAARNGVPDDDEIDVTADVVGRIAGVGWNPPARGKAAL